MFPSTTILFYSGSVEDEVLRRMIADKQVEGVYCAARRRFIERAGSLVDQTTRALDRLSGMRGLAMRVVAECDELMKTAMLSMSKRDPNCAGKISELDRDVLQFIESTRKAYEASIGSDLDGRLATRAVDSAKLFKHFWRLTQVATTNPKAFGLNDEQVERLRELRNTSAQYDRNVLGKRNILGLVVEIQNDSGWILQGSDEISIVDFPEIRRVFATHIDVFLNEIRSLVVLLDQ